MSRISFCESCTSMTKVRDAVFVWLTPPSEKGLGDRQRHDDCGGGRRHRGGRTPRDRGARTAERSRTAPGVGKGAGRRLGVGHRRSQGDRLVEVREAAWLIRPRTGAADTRDDGRLIRAGRSHEREPAGQDRRSATRCHNHVNGPRHARRGGRRADRLGALNSDERCRRSANRDRRVAREPPAADGHRRAAPRAARLPARSRKSTARWA